MPFLLCKVKLIMFLKGHLMCLGDVRSLSRLCLVILRLCLVILRLCLVIEVMFGHAEFLLNETIVNGCLII